MSKRELFEKEIDNESNIPKEKRNLDTKSYDYSVDYTYNLITSGKIILEVPFQRNLIWKDDRKSQLIESLIMNVPIPPLYFSEEDGGSWLVLDGLQRLSSIQNYFENEFPLEKLEIVKELEGKKYKDLPPKAKELLKDSLLRFNVIRKDSHPDIKFDIFMRLNKGSVILNNQELRNCLYRGKLNDLLREIVKDKNILETLNLKKPHDRYLDIEFILRFLSFSENLKSNKDGYYINKYTGGLKSFINNFMKDNKDPSEDKLKSISEKIKETFKKVNTVLGYKGLLNPKTKSSQINKAFADVIFLSFEKKELSSLVKKKHEIVQIIHKLIENQQFLQAISRRTSDHSAIKLRLTMWFKEFEKCL